MALKRLKNTALYHKVMRLPIWILSNCISDLSAVKKGLDASDASGLVSRDGLTAASFLSTLPNTGRILQSKQLSYAADTEAKHTVA